MKTNKTICLNSKVNGKQPSIEHRVYDVGGVSMAITCSYLPSIAEPTIVAMRGRNPDNPSERGKSNGRYKQRIEMNQNGTSNTITSVQKDNLVVEPKVRQVGNIYPDTDGFKNRTMGRVYSNKGVSPTINCCGGGDREPKIIDDTFPGRKERVYEEESPSLRVGGGGFKVAEPKAEEKLKVPQPTAQGYAECEVGGVFDGSYPKSTTRRGRVQEGGNIAPTLTAEGERLNRYEGATMEQGEMQYRIRKLTPRECFRLMDVDEHNIDKIQTYIDPDTNKPISNSQQYKGAGNSICVNPMYLTFKNLFYPPKIKYRQMTIFEML